MLLRCHRSHNFNKLLQKLCSYITNTVTGVYLITLVFYLLFKVMQFLSVMYYIALIVLLFRNIKFTILCI